MSTKNQTGPGMRDRGIGRVREKKQKGFSRFGITNFGVSNRQMERKKFPGKTLKSGGDEKSGQKWEHRALSPGVDDRVKYHSDRLEKGRKQTDHEFQIRLRQWIDGVRAQFHSSQSMIQGPGRQAQAWD
jgi:hypothetical protein